MVVTVYRLGHTINSPAVCPCSLGVQFPLLCLAAWNVLAKHERLQGCYPALLPLPATLQHDTDVDY